MSGIERFHRVLGLAYYAQISQRYKKKIIMNYWQPSVGASVGHSIRTMLPITAHVGVLWVALTVSRK